LPRFGNYLLVGWKHEGTGAMKPVETWKNQLGILEDEGPYLLVHLLVSATLLPSFVCPHLLVINQ
jgi:hypothetical protein